jgi:methyl-accepting chemotaxis protein
MYRTYLLPLSAAIEVENTGESGCCFAMVAQTTW